MQVIKFDKDAIDINCIIKIGFTNRAYQDMSKLTTNPEAYIAALSKLPRLIITPREDDDMFSLHTTFGNFLCGVNQKSNDGFSIITFRENDLYSQNKALKFGIIFNVNNGIDAEVLLPNADMHYRYLSGEKYDFNALDCGDTSPSMNLIMDTIRENKKDKRIKTNESINETQLIDEFTEYDIDYEEIYLKEILKESEQYSILSSELEEKKTQEMGRLSYREFFATDYERIDRIAYQFIVDNIDKSVFKAGVQVEFEGRHQERINGEIVDVDDSDKENIKVTILFNNQISIECLSAFGWISLSFSTVNKDVQLAANEKILNKTAKAKYFKAVLGGKNPAGFDTKDLSLVKAKLAQKKYPPNDSQMMAIEKGINSKDIFLVMGPPGTGKTTVILEWVKYFVGVEHKRVLVSSQNNKAVDNVLARLAEEKDIDVIRIGSEAKLQSEVIPYMFENKLSALNQNIDFATNNAIHKLEVAISDWKVYRDSFYIFGKQLDDINLIAGKLKEDIQNDIIPLKIKLKEIYLQYQDLFKQYKEALKKLEECKSAIEDYEQKNFILKKFLEKRHEANLLAKQQLELIYQQQILQLEELKKKYKRYSDIYINQVGIIRGKFVSEMKKAKKRSQKEIERFSDNRPANPQIGHLFEKIQLTQTQLDSAIKLRMFLQSVDAEIQRAYSILEVEKEWRNNVVGKQNYALNEIVLETVDLVGATCIGINSQKRFSNLHFDVTIIDEAGQIQIHNALVPMSVSNKLIMLGDYKQIPPSADQELVELCELNGVNPELLKKSLFEKLFVELPESNKMMLDTQYRMPGEIADVISEWFYGGEYKSPDFKRELKGLLPVLSKKPFVIIDTSMVAERYETRTDSRGTYNVLEADICKEILKYIVESDAEIDFKEIGIISAYKDQVGKIKSKLSKIVGVENANEMVATLDSFQGQERDLILYSFTKSSTKKPTVNRIGFLNELRRLNVAMSRCKKTLVMIGDMEFLSGCMHQNVDDEGNEIYNQSEKEFSDFIRKMMNDVEDGRGEIISYKQFVERLGL